MKRLLILSTLSLIAFFNSQKTEACSYVWGEATLLWTQGNKKGFTCTNDDNKMCIRWRCGESNPKKVEVYFPSGTVEGELASSHAPAPPNHEDGTITQPAGIYILED